MRRVFPLVILCACASREVGRTPATSPGDDSRVRSPSMAEAVVSLPGSGAESYRTDGEPPEDASSRAVASLGVGESLVADGRLDRAAAAVARMLEDGATFNSMIVTEAMLWNGVPETSPWGGVIREANENEAKAAVSAWLAERAREGANRVGIAESRGPAGVQVVLLAVANRLSLDPVPRRLPAPGVQTVAGRAGAPCREVRLVLTDPAGSVHDVAAKSARQRFTADLDLDAEGMWAVEIACDSPRGPLPLANMRLAVGIAHPQSLVTPRAGDEPADVAGMEALLVQKINASRAERSLAPLAASGDLARVARAYSEEMARTGVVAHVSPESGTAMDRVVAAGLAYPVVRENLAEAPTVAEAHQGLLDSPAHRKNILDPDAYAVGVGVAFKERDRGRSLLVTEIFAARPAAIPPDASERIVMALNARRAAAGVRSLEVAPALSAAARRLSRSCFEGNASGDGLRVEGASFSKLKMVAVTTGSLDDAVEDAGRLERSATHVGAAVSQGRHPRLGDGVICVVLIFGTR